MALFAGVADMYTTNGPLMAKIQMFPKALLASFNFDLKLMGTFEGWMAAEAYIFFVLLLGSFGAIWSSTSIAREKDKQTIAFLLTLPYSRFNIYFSKALAHFIQLTLVGILATGTTLFFGYTFSTIHDVGDIVLLMFAGYITALSFTGIGYLVSVIIRIERSALSLGIAITLVSFLIETVSKLQNSISWLTYFSLFHAINTDDIVRTHTLSLQGIFILLFVYFGSLVIGSFIFHKQDISSS
jgi:ABC-type transport system involved in multi-copper enzyme maturation permease subunit